MITNRKKLKAAKELCNSSAIGSHITCPSCGTVFTKKSYNSVFCKTKPGTRCKDNFWNNTDPTKRNNTRRISPANARYYTNTILPQKAAELGFPDVATMKAHVEEDDGSWEAHSGVNVAPCQWCNLRYEYCRCD